MALQDLTPQLRTRLRRVEKIVGLFVTLATLVLLGGFAYYLHHTAARKGWFTPKCPYYTFVATGEGLSIGDPVVLMGFSIGKIKTIEAQPPGSWYHVFVGFEVKQPYYGYIWSDSKVHVAAAGFLGQRRIEITPGTAGEPTVYEQNGQISEILVEKKRIPLAQQPKGVFIEPLEEPALTERAEKLVSQIETALPNILAITNRVNTVLDNLAGLLTNSTATITQIQPLLSNATVITANLRDPHGSLGNWLIPTNINTKLDATLGTANTQLTELATSLDKTLLNLATITSNLNQQVQSNDQILSRISQSIVDTDDLIQGLKRHWFLRGAFQKKPVTTNTPPSKLSTRLPAK